MNEQITPNEARDSRQPESNAGWLRRFIGWLRCPPNESDAFLVNIRLAIQAIWGTACEWEHRIEPGEEEHGKDPSKRYCTQCGKCQHGWYHRFGDTRATWTIVLGLASAGAAVMFGYLSVK